MALQNAWSTLSPTARREGFCRLLWPDAKALFLRLEAHDHTKVPAKWEHVEVTDDRFSSEPITQDMVDPIDSKGIVIPAIGKKDFRHSRLS